MPQVLGKVSLPRLERTSYVREQHASTVKIYSSACDGNGQRTTLNTVTPNSYIVLIPTLHSSRYARTGESPPVRVAADHVERPLRVGRYRRQRVVAQMEYAPKD
jgi:hypothetical protein